VLPMEIEALRGVDVASVSAGGGHVLALTYTGGVYSWGVESMALGHGGPAFRHDDTIGGIQTHPPERVEALRGMRVRCVAAGGEQSCAVTDDGHVYTWGYGGTGCPRSHGVSVILKKKLVRFKKPRLP